MNADWFLVKNFDWITMENSYIFNKASIERLKSEMIRMGAAEKSDFGTFS
jgi:hypothetical protein